jgi:hypothetical protein
MVRRASQEKRIAFPDSINENLIRIRISDTQSPTRIIE